MSPDLENKVKDEVAALNLGSKIRNLRKQRAMTLQEVSDATGLSKPLLSQVENNIAAPPIATLIKISTALGVKISHFFREQNHENRVVVVKKDQRYGIKKLSHHNKEMGIGYRYESLAYPMVGKQMEPFIAEIEPRKEQEMLYNDHKGEEFLHVMEGTVEFKSSDQTHTLEMGDSIYFDSSIPHALRGIGGTAKSLVVIFTPK
ncbi:MAG: helix-turn-helix domain-containing protein [Desulfobacteraceae bacterium]|nr:MAG: helix-turn-helix domain-containing protein [Desulfobacteraceae bacterium]